jgi:hypothetical protein
MDQPEVTAGHLLDEGRIFPEAPHLLAKRVVLTLQRSHSFGEAGLLAAGQPRGQQAALAD